MVMLGHLLAVILIQKQIGGIMMNYLNRTL